MVSRPKNETSKVTKPKKSSKGKKSVKSDDKTETQLRKLSTWLSEKGFSKTFKALEKESKKKGFSLTVQESSSSESDEEDTVAKAPVTSNITDKDFHQAEDEKAFFGRLNAEVWEKKIAEKKLLQDNSYFASRGNDNFATDAAKELGKVKGESFRKEKAKKKRATWQGGQLSYECRSIKFD